MNEPMEAEAYTRLMFMSLFVFVLSAYAKLHYIIHKW